MGYENEFNCVLSSELDDFRFPMEIIFDDVSFAFAHNRLTFALTFIFLPFNGWHFDIYWISMLAICNLNVSTTKKEKKQSLKNHLFETVTF